MHLQFSRLDPARELSVLHSSRERCWLGVGHLTGVPLVEERFRSFSHGQLLDVSSPVQFPYHTSVPLQPSPARSTTNVIPVWFHVGFMLVSCCCEGYKKDLQVTLIGLGPAHSYVALLFHSNLGFPSLFQCIHTKFPPTHCRQCLLHHLCRAHMRQHCFLLSHLETHARCSDMDHSSFKASVKAAFIFLNHS